MLEISIAARDELALQAWLERTREFVVEQSPDFARCDPEFQRDFVAVQLEQVAEYGLESEESLPTLALTSWYLGLAHFSQLPEFAEILQRPGSESRRLSSLREMTECELAHRARANAALH